MGVASQSSEQVLTTPDGFRAFYQEALPRVYSYLFHRCGGIASVAEDLTQETFLAAVREITRGRSMDDPLAWIIGVARHKLVDHFRKEARAERKLTLAWQAAAIDDRLMVPLGEESRERTLAALRSIPASQRAALVLRYLDGLSVPEVAASLGRTVHATESLLARGRESFKRAYVEAEDE